MYKFLKQIEPIIRSKIRKYRRYIKNMDDDDLMQEGYAAALIAANRWKTDQNKASLTAWTWIHIESKFKELSTRPLGIEISLEDLDIEISQEYAHTIWGQSHDKEEPDDTQEEITRMLIKSMPKYEDFLECVIDKNLSNISAAKNMGLTKQRISQLYKELQKALVDGSGKQFSKKSTKIPDDG